jgi:glyoxylase-like metal-dependent hydrolase (beta-lactamase superfamily II)
MRIIRKEMLYQLTFLPRMFPVNCYLVEESNELTLIDAALPYSTKGILQAANQIGKPITRIILTHGHGDHVGALDKLKQALPEVLVYISKRDSRILAGDVTLEVDEPNSPIRGDVPKHVQTRADRYISEGEHIGSLLAIAVPGHTPGSMAFLDTRNRALIAGDAFQTRGGIAVSGQMKPWFPFPAMATWHKQTALESAKKLLLHQPSILAVGHGRMLFEPKSAMDLAITTAEINLMKHT